MTAGCLFLTFFVKSVVWTVKNLFVSSTMSVLQLNLLKLLENKLPAVTSIQLKITPKFYGGPCPEVLNDRDHSDHLRHRCLLR